VVSEVLTLALQGVNLGVLGIVFYLFVGGKLHSDAEFQRIVDDRDTERTAHERTREALRLASARADTGVMTAQIVAQALGAGHVLEQRSSYVAPPPSS
jgi:hypothetical protein